MPDPGAAEVLAVARDDAHRFAKETRESITLLRGLGVDGDAHCGATVQHRSRLARTPAAPNLRQVHLIHAELFDELARAGFACTPGALVELTGLRNPCRQIDENMGPGAMAATLGQAPDGSLIRKAGVMAVVLQSGEVRPGDPIRLELPRTFEPLEPV